MHAGSQEAEDVAIDKFTLATSSSHLGHWKVSTTAIMLIMLMPHLQSCMQYSLLSRFHDKHQKQLVGTLEDVVDLPIEGIINISHHSSHIGLRVVKYVRDMFTTSPLKHNLNLLLLSGRASNT